MYTYNDKFTTQKRNLQHNLSNSAEAFEILPNFKFALHGIKWGICDHSKNGSLITTKKGVNFFAK